jgi:hypothetical protein
MELAFTVACLCQLTNKHQGCLTKNLHSNKKAQLCISKFVLFVLILQGPLISTMTWADLFSSSTPEYWGKHISESQLSSISPLIPPMGASQSVPSANFCLTKELCHFETTRCKKPRKMIMKGTAVD